MQLVECVSKFDLSFDEELGPAVNYTREAYMLFADTTTVSNNHITNTAVKPKM
jgi:hypothetical protein